VASSVSTSARVLKTLSTFPAAASVDTHTHTHTHILTNHSLAIYSQQEGLAVASIARDVVA